MPISGIYKIKGVGDVLAGRVEQGVVKPGEEAHMVGGKRRCLGRVFRLAAAFGHLGPGTLEPTGCKMCSNQRIFRPAKVPHLYRETKRPLKLV